MKGWRGFLIGIGIMCVGWKTINLQHIMEVWVLHKAATRVLSADALAVSFGSSIAKTIIEYDTPQCAPQELQTFAMNTFPFIKSMTIQVRLGKKTVSYLVYNPTIMCNDTYLLLENGIAVSKEQYRSETYQSLPSFYMESVQTCKDVAACMAFVKNKEKSFFRDFSVIWRDQTCIELVLNNPKITFIIDENNYQKDDFLKKVNVIKQEVVSLNEGRKKPLLYKADLRFADCMVLSLQKGGVS